MEAERIIGSVDEQGQLHLPRPVGVRPGPAEVIVLPIGEGEAGIREADQAPAPRPSIMELHGLGKEIWTGVDADEFVRESRKEWESRP